MPTESHGHCHGATGEMLSVRGIDVSFSLQVSRGSEKTSPRDCLFVGGRIKSTQGHVMSPWQVRRGAAPDLGEERSLAEETRRRRSPSNPYGGITRTDGAGDD